ncbi:hypothetical protein [Methylocystis heyeri]|uniref:Uncharacterized protein n=1 Tax=Methylocystis heyeri TaxID=391905 RepID=A0A6B8KGK4_9HYPH|nr:hypothetical protein [Methylocystis heyeri]QGM46105.1 hypothetical protein H2LOC_010600 [Methylocystis heyeri]
MASDALKARVAAELQANIEMMDEAVYRLTALLSAETDVTGQSMLANAIATFQVVKENTLGLHDIAVNALEMVDRVTKNRSAH